MSAKDALNRFYEREAKRASRKPRKNQKPEFEFKKVCKRWLDENGWCCDVVESKAVYNFEAGRYDHGQAEAGFSDIVGVTPYFGVAAFIELKAPGKRSTLKQHQRDFLLKKIEAGAFAVCIDSTELLDATFRTWCDLRQMRKFERAKSYLVEQLPKVKEKSCDSFSQLLSDERQSQS